MARRWLLLYVTLQTCHGLAGFGAMKKASKPKKKKKRPRHHHTLAQLLRVIHDLFLTKLFLLRIARFELHVAKALAELFKFLPILEFLQVGLNPTLVHVRANSEMRDD